MKTKRLPLRHAGLCVSGQVEDEELRSQLHETFGEAPVLVASVSHGTFQSLHSGPSRGMVSAALRVSDHGCFTVVLVLQFNALQLRCVASLGHPMFVELLAHAQAHGCINVLLGDEYGDGSGATQLPFDERDVAMLMAAVRAQADAGSEFRLGDADGKVMRQQHGGGDAGQILGETALAQAVHQRRLFGAGAIHGAIEARHLVGGISPRPGLRHERRIGLLVRFRAACSACLLVPQCLCDWHPTNRQLQP